MSDLKFGLRLFRFDNDSLYLLLLAVFELDSLLDFFGFQGLGSPDQRIQHGRLAATGAADGEDDILVFGLYELLLQVVDDDDEADEVAFELLKLLFIV